MPKVAALVDAHSLRAFMVIPKACSSLGLVHPATTTFSFLFLVFFYCSVPVFFLFFSVFYCYAGAIELLVTLMQLLFINKCCAQGRYPCGGGHGVQSLHSTRRLSTHPSWVLYTELVARCIFILGFLSSWEQTEKFKPNILTRLFLGCFLCQFCFSWCCIFILEAVLSCACT
jgi:hypothetical protein